MKEKIKRTRSAQVRLSQEEYDFLEQKFQLSGYKSKSEFMRIAFFDTLIVKFSTEDMQELLRLVRSISNNVNQIAVRVNSTDKVYVEDMNNIKDGVEKIWQQLRYFQSQLRSVKQRKISLGVGYEPSGTIVEGKAEIHDRSGHKEERGLR